MEQISESERLFIDTLLRQCSMLLIVGVWILGPVVMVKSGYSEKGLMRKVAVQALFGKIYYLSELPEFCARDNSYVVKEIFGVTDEDAEEIRLHTISEDGDLDSLEKLVENSESKDSSDGSSNAP